MDDFFNRLAKAGAELVFFLDGMLQTTKRETWIRRQNEKYNKMITVMDYIDRDTPVSVVAQRNGWKVPNNTGLKLRRVAKRHGKTITSMHVECDKALAAYAVEHQALAVISDDTDFLIYQGDWKLWSSKRINLQTLDTFEFNRAALVRTLGLQRHQMPLFATLAGNDFFQYDEVKPFHVSLVASSCYSEIWQKFLKLAEYVRSLPPNRKLSSDTIFNILERVYRDRTMPQEATDWFEHSLSFYKIDCESVIVNQPMNPMEMFLLNADQHFVHSIVTADSINCSLYFYDYRLPGIGNYFDIIARIICRTAGIILFHRRQEGQKHVIIMSKRSHTEPYSLFTVPVEFPTKIVPPEVMDLLSPDANIALLGRKLQLLAWVCSDSLPLGPFAALPPSLMVTIMTLYRLMECGALMLFEADLLLCIAHEILNDHYDPTAERLPHRLDPRAFRIGFMFQKVYGEFNRACKALGLPVTYRPSTPYDGHRFHNRYGNWRDGRMQPRSIANWRLYIKNIR